MRVPQSNSKVIQINAPAKINLYLKVFGKRPDGYHNLHSLMQMIGLYDELSFKEDKFKTQLEVEDQILPEDQNNLVLQAVLLVQKKMRSLGLPNRDVQIKLKKNIPIAAGLAGGSSDAVATLIALNTLWNLKWSKSTLQTLSAQLGSDLPFFFEGPAAWISGRGERVQASVPPFNSHLVLIYPQIYISTATIFQAYAREQVLTKESPAPTISTASERLTADDLILHPTNDLEPYTLKLFPQLKALKVAIQSFSGKFTLMSGSGSSFLTLFEDKKEAEHVAHALGHMKQFGLVQTWVLPLLQHSPYAPFFETK